MNVKTYSSKSNAARAAKATNGGTLDGLELHGVEGAWHYVKPAPAPKAPKAAGGVTYKALSANTGKSAVEKPVLAMLNLCEQMSGQPRKDVIAAAVELGISYYTARTQYQVWYKAGR